MRATLAIKLVNSSSPPIAAVNGVITAAEEQAACMHQPTRKAIIWCLDQALGAEVVNSQTRS